MPATAFIAPGSDALGLRWFSPVAELQLCGHGTLAAGCVMLDVVRPGTERVAFDTPAGQLKVERDGERLAVDLPVLRLQARHAPESVAPALGITPIELWEADGGRALAVLDEAAQVRDFKADRNAIAALPFSALILTARGWDGDCDFVSRYFAPKFGLAEDFVTGSAHCVLAPYWAAKLGKPQLFARQLSSRGGELWVADRGARVRVAGTCVPIAEGTFTLD